MSEKTRVVRGLRDIYPGESERFDVVERSMIEIIRKYGYEEIRLPMLESIDLFKRGLGEATDAVEKEMYTLEDRDHDILALRPEGTASCVRAVIDRNLIREGKPRLWYAGPMFRYERPQKGRYRQFYQIGAEAFGLRGPDVDAELILMGSDMWQVLGLESAVELEMNTIGSGDSRRTYCEALVKYLTPRKKELDSDSERRLTTNPMRILDSKNASTQKLLESAPDLHDFVDSASRSHFEDVCEYLDREGISFRVNPRLVRGLDYYTDTVFEWVTDKLGSQGTICAGGRYDGLFERLGGPSVPAAGFAAGLDRVVLLHETMGMNIEESAVDVYVIVMERQHEAYARRVAQFMRSETSLRIRQHMGGGKVGVQMRQADRSGARWAVIVGDDEVSENRVALKWLREETEQKTMDFEQLAACLNKAVEPQ
ncbi:MAG: histidine--tRNA ligase [Pseudomonadota bacterium]|uniref:histidine--tRNA ligase n=1 Tax=marine metagenome TaxID=408172 RepID=A0A381MZB1_9ZZZZ|nr:histidine--tRNA ligase [Pseudomonadota bacterium]MEC8868571.1 histidine--tRNA ligase [Pseudomonadota bacterium]MEC9284567.1 histidine--tRNA ligase [Pseudomonadota bacterium]HBP14889.1 histidine--tRNA ligase [Gammaproteobacteria bacterium]HCP49930.1 histidine--tRNA ligase [Gammaproteobacteria bacterium]|tara:strand:+ start:4241 stop:5518 length:1278 start_codon:yes stop_codon:yes gene_type:complete